MRIPLLAVLSLGFAAVLPAAKPLEVYFIDVEGGQATFLVAPSGESMLVDTGWSGHNGRDADRIAAVAKKAGVKRIDYLVITHYHEDHVGGITLLAERLPIRNFVDHGENVESDRHATELTRAYTSFRAKGTHLEVKPGDTIPIKGLDVTVLSSAGKLLKDPMPGAGSPNPQCAESKKQDEDKSENAQSVGVLVTMGKFRMIDLGDLTWNKELELMCPSARVPPVDVYVVSHHGMNISGSPALVHAIRPRVAIMDNGARKGGTPGAWDVIQSSPGLENVWQLHYSVAGGKDRNPPDTFIANTDEICEGKWLRVTARPDGGFTIVNSRNNYMKTYDPR